MKKGYCAKCKKFEYLEEHHILPKKTFGKNKETEFLCPNCHNAYHQYLGNENLSNNDAAFHFLSYYRWKAGLVVFLLLMLALISLVTV